MESNPKPRVTQAYEKLNESIQEQVKLAYPEGFSQHLIPFVNKEGKKVKALRFETDEKIYLIRMCDICVISSEDAISWGLTGPNLRGSGITRDLRKDNPYLGYENYDFDIPIGENGDSYDRYLVRMEEMRQSVRILRQVCGKMPDGPVNVVDPKGTLPDKERVMMSMEELIHHFIVATQGIDAPEGEVYVGAENPKGELGFYINSKGGGVPHRLKIRSPSFVNLSILPKLLPGNMVSDVVAILGSLDFVMGECDR